MTKLLSSLEWPSLEQRRAESRISMFYRIVHNLVDIDADKLLTRATRITRTSKCDPFNFIRYQVSKDCFKFSFVPRTIIQWNNLPSDVVNAGDLDWFRQKLADIDLTLQGRLYHY